MFCNDFFFWINSFRLIVVAEKQDVYKKFPIPLINRLEKHFLATTNMLTDVQIHIAKKLDEWAKDFATLHRTQRRSKEKYVWFPMYELDGPINLCVKYFKLIFWIIVVKWQGKLKYAVTILVNLTFAGLSQRWLTSSLDSTLMPLPQSHCTFLQPELMQMIEMILSGSQRYSKRNGIVKLCS